MLDLHRTDTTPATKIYFTHSNLPSYIDPQNVSTKKHPFATFNKQHFSHTLDLILPEELYEVVRQKLDTYGTGHYARAHLKLTEILEPEFLSTYIKQGNIMMLSEGRPLVDNYFSLYDGILRLELDRQTYERCGLQGVPIEDGGKKHQKARWVVTYNLRLPSMKHGRSGFSRLEWAAKNVLDRSLTWLFYNFNPSSGEAMAQGKEVLSKYAPWACKMEPSVIRLNNTVCPKLETKNLSTLYEEDESMALLEWMDMVSLESPRIKADDDIDPYLSRYEVPEFGAGRVTRNVVCLRWKGFIPSAFAREIFLAARRDGFKSRAKTDDSGNTSMEDGTDEEKWFAISAQGFGGKNSWTVLQFADNATLTWEREG